MVYRFYRNLQRNTEVVLYFNGNAGNGNKYIAERKDTKEQRPFVRLKDAHDYLVQKQGYILWRVTYTKGGL